MYQAPEPTRPIPDLLAQGVRIPGWTVVTWTAVGPTMTWPPELRSDVEMAECTCPIDCIRDHETD